jgi:hypothetical protein
VVSSVTVVDTGSTVTTTSFTIDGYSITIGIPYASTGFVSEDVDTEIPVSVAGVASSAGLAVDDVSGVV